MFLFSYSVTVMEIAVGEYGADVGKVIKAALKKYYEMSSECIKLDPVFDDGECNYEVQFRRCAGLVAGFSFKDFNSNALSCILYEVSSVIT